MGASTNVAPVIIKRKKVVAGGGHHGGAWKVAYADFVTAMMAFFMLMWLLNATTEKQRKGIADYFSPAIPIHRVSGGADAVFGGADLFAEDTLSQRLVGSSNLQPTESRQARGNSGVDDAGGRESSEEAFTTVEEALKGRAGESMVSEDVARHIITRVTDEGLVIELFERPGTLLFETGSDAPTQLMADLAGVVARVSGLVSNEVAIGGHIRSNPIVAADNPVWEMSSARASQVRGLLESSGLDQSRVRRVTGHADRSLADDDPFSVRNNRIEIILLRSGRR